MNATPTPTPRPPDIPPSETFMLAADHEGRQIVSVHVKRSYTLRPDGRCVREEQQAPLTLAPGADDEPTGFCETDIVPLKQSTDVIVMAHAWARGATAVTARIRIGPLDLQYKVSGDRRVSYRGRGSWAFEAPQPFESIGMCYERAYGGFDDTVPNPEVVHVIDMFDVHPGEYPRNPVGLGYVVYENRERIDGLALPNLEHPQMLLTPERLVVGDPRAGGAPHCRGAANGSTSSGTHASCTIGGSRPVCPTTIGCSRRFASAGSMPVTHVESRS